MVGKVARLPSTVQLVETARLLAKDLGVELEIVPTSWRPTRL
jgi:hypothetical protein